MKNYFYFSREQKIGVAVLLTLIVLLMVAGWLLPCFLKDENRAGDSRFMQEVTDFKASLKNRKKEQKNGNFIEQKLFVFDPNTLDSIGFVSLGIKPKIARNILKYRQKGGKFRTARDFSKIYGISESQFNALLPYISVEVREVKKVIEIREFEPVEKKEKIKKPKKEIFTVELNTADTTELKKIRGIGSVFAERIVKYREKLGGFVGKEQLKEVYGIKPEMYDQIEKYIVIDKPIIRKIRINKVNVERLTKHPYLRFYAAKAIYDQRRKLGKLNSADDLRNLEDLPDETLEKILPYLSFE